VEEFVRGVERELALRYSDFESWPVESLYLGGGTPSRLGGLGVQRLMDVLLSRITLLPGAEVTIEVNPDDVTGETAAAWCAAGINRLSLGAQSFHDSVLRWMHRTHDAAAIPRAVDAIRDAGFDSFSLDLIFALPEALERSWERDLSAALALQPNHLSLYGLTIEPRTPLARWEERGATRAASDDRYADEYLLAHRAMSDAGFEHYEVSNFARPGARARHNSAYWRGVPYAGVGPGAHEFDGAARRWNVGAYAAWQRILVAGGDPKEGSELLDEANRAAESVYLGLRTTNGLRLSDMELGRAERWVVAGWAEITDGRLRLTPTGWLRLDSLAADLTLVRSHS
jgi:putative oxygen-independent coproporphyrinogen III oxidase